MPRGLFNTSQRRDPMERLPRKERERQRRQREFLATAEEVFSRKGFHSTTIQEISEKSEFAVGSIYHMFRNKDEIYTALLQMRMEEYLSLLEEKIKNCRGPAREDTNTDRNEIPVLLGTQTVPPALPGHHDRFGRECAIRRSRADHSQV